MRTFIGLCSGLLYFFGSGFSLIGFLGGLTIWPHSDIPVTVIPEYPLGLPYL